MTSERFHALLAAAPASFRRDVTAMAPHTADYAVAVPRLDHTIETFRIRVHDAEPVPEVEEIGGRLPRWCPERHIVGDGRFCLSWSPEPSALDTPEALTEWWQKLLGYLGLQLVADVTRHWPPSKQWAHGAAREQHAFEEFARNSDPRVVHAVKSRSVRVLNCGRIEGRRRPCPCGSDAKVMRCHEDDIVLLSELLAKQELAERAFWLSCAQKPCCGTMGTCPLTPRKHA